MTDDDVNTPFRIGAWLVEPSLNRLIDGDSVVTLEPRVIAVLVCLASQPGRMISAEERLSSRHRIRRRSAYADRARAIVLAANLQLCDEHTTKAQE